MSQAQQAGGRSGVTGESEPLCRGLEAQQDLLVGVTVQFTYRAPSRWGSGRNDGDSLVMANLAQDLISWQIRSLSLALQC
jgi:hypothetical protein